MDAERVRGVGKTLLLNELLPVPASGIGSARRWRGRGRFDAGGVISGVGARDAHRDGALFGAAAAPALRGVQGVQPDGERDPEGVAGCGGRSDSRSGGLGSIRRRHRGVVRGDRQTARELGIGVLILVDELQQAHTEELVVIKTALHHLGQGQPSRIGVDEVESARHKKSGDEQIATSTSGGRQSHAARRSPRQGATDDHLTHSN